MATKTEWWDKNGDVHDGYIIDGQTYLDEAGTARVPVGATVKTNGGTFQMTENGGVPTMATARNQYQQQSNAAIDAYTAASEAQRRRVQSATDAAIAEINRQKQVAEQNRRDADIAAREAYRAAANPFGALEEQRVRLGLDNSGYAESSKLKLASDYAAQQTANLRSLNEQLSALEVQIAEARANGELKLANILESRAQNVMNQRTALAGNLFNADMSAISQAAQESQFREQMAAQKAQAEEQKRLEFAAALIEANASGSAAQIANAFGVKEEDVNALISARKAQEAAALSAQRRSGGEYVSNEEAQKKAAALALIATEIQGSGMPLAEWLATYGAAYKLTNEDVMTLQGMMQGAKGNGTGFDAVKTNVREMKQRGYDKARIVEYLDGVSETELTDNGYRVILETFFPDER